MTRTTAVGAIACVLPLLAHVALAGAAAAQSPHTSLSASVLRYSTGDEINCPDGSGLSIDVERRLGIVPIAAGLGMRMADAFTCATVGPPMRSYKGEIVHETAGLSLMFAPAASLSAGYDVRIGAIELSPRLRGGITYARSDGKLSRSVLQFGHAELRAGRGRWGGVVRLGGVRAPTYYQRTDGSIAATFWHWRRTAELGVEMRR